MVCRYRCLNVHVAHAACCFSIITMHEQPWHDRLAVKAVERNDQIMHAMLLNTKDCAVSAWLGIGDFEMLVKAS